MLTGTQAELEQRIELPRWSVATRVAFRFHFVYFGLFCLTTQIFGALFPAPNLQIPDPATLWPVRPIVFWTAAHVFGLKTPLVYQGSGSGDKTFDWILVFCLLIIAALATIVWSILDRKRRNYAGLYKWFRLFVRFALASQMILYGVLKIIPLQMPFPVLTRLLEPYGNFLSHGSPLVFGRRFPCIRDLHRLRRNIGRHSFDFFANHARRRADLRRRCDRDFRAEHDL